MAVSLNHTIIPAHDPKASAEFLARLLGLEVEPFVHFQMVRISPDLTLDYDERRGEFSTNHYAFRVSAQEFDAIFGRIKEMGLNYYSDQLFEHPGELNDRRNGRGFYFMDPNGHNFEVMTWAD